MGVEVEDFGQEFGLAEEDLDADIDLQHGKRDVDLWVA